jgi:hypothetical protein
VLAEEHRLLVRVLRQMEASAVPRGAAPVILG